MNKETDYRELLEEIKVFIEARNWEENKDPKDVALSLTLEAAELLENFQWQTSEAAIKNNIENIKDEVADVFIYLLQFVDILDLDLIDISHKKMKKNGLKYPAVKK